MIDTDNEGQKHLDDMVEAVDDSLIFNHWDQKFLMNVANIGYADLSPNQKAKVSNIYEKFKK